MAEETTCDWFRIQIHDTQKTTSMSPEMKSPISLHFGILILRVQEKTTSCILTLCYLLTFWESREEKN